MEAWCDIDGNLDGEEQVLLLDADKLDYIIWTTGT